MMPANAQGIVAAATMEPTAVLPPDVRAAPCDDDGETLILYPLTTPNGSARYELPESIQHACNAHTPPTKVPSAQQKVVSNTRRTVQREVLADVIQAAARRALKAVFLSWRLHSGLPKRTPSVVLAELAALVEQQVASAKAIGSVSDQGAPAHAEHDYFIQRDEDCEDAKEEEGHQDTFNEGDRAFEEGEIQEERGDAERKEVLAFDIVHRLGELTRRVESLERSNRWPCGRFLLAIYVLIVHVALLFRSPYARDAQCWGLYD